MFLGVKQSRERVAEMVKAMPIDQAPEDLRVALTDWLENMNVSAGTRERADALVAVKSNGNNSNYCYRQGNCCN